MAKTQYSLARLAPEYRRMWDSLRVLPAKRKEAEAAARLILRGKDKYQRVERETGVKWSAVGTIHYRESRCDFNTWLHNGDRMRDRNGRPIRTRQVPKGRPPDPSVDWFKGAYDALVTVEHFDQIKNYGVAEFAFSQEKMNGFGYRNPRINIPSPYLVGGSNLQKRGKYVGDGHYDASHWDTQLGGLTILKALIELDPDAGFDFEPMRDVSKDVDDTAPDAKDYTNDEDGTDAEEDVPPAYSPKAADPTQDKVKPLRRSKTIWGGVMTWLAGMGSTIAGMFEYLATPWGFAIFATLLTAISVGAFLVIKGRIDVQQLVEHLSPDGDIENTQED